MTAMYTATNRLVAAIPLLIGGLVVTVSALAVVLARILVDAGMTVSSADALLLDDVVAVLPFVIAFAGASLAAAYGLLTGRSWADGLAIGSAIVAVAVGGLGLLLIVIGRDPVAPAASSGPSADGFGILTSFVVLYVVAIVALLAAHAPRRIATGATTA